MARSEEYIRDFDTRQIIGILETKDNGDVYAYDFFTRKILGIYRVSTDDTIDFEKRQIQTKGNSVVSFIYACWAKNPNNPKNKR